MIANCMQRIYLLFYTMWLFTPVPFSFDRQLTHSRVTSTDQISPHLETRSLNSHYTLVTDF